MSPRKLLKELLSGSRNVRFSELVAVVEAFGFHLDRISGSHHIFIHPKITELVNIQDVHGQAKPYQVRQVLKLIERHHLKLEDRP